MIAHPMRIPVFGCWSLLFVFRQIPEPLGNQWGHEEQRGHAGGKDGDLSPPGQARQGRNRPQLGPRDILVPGLDEAVTTGSPSP